MHSASFVSGSTTTNKMSHDLNILFITRDGLKSVRILLIDGMVLIGRQDFSIIYFLGSGNGNVSCDWNLLNAY